ncbi:hypothetical protein [Halopelagius fulvigenes]|uniref:hypothetical protein n=1 Tax=Halopelagius fulvigenes TaxID=1198324 RepID=UPI0036D2A0FA
MFTPVGIPYYLFRRFRRGGFGDRERPPTGRDRLLAAWAAASLVAFGVGSVVSPPDPFSQLLCTLERSVRRSRFRPSSPTAAVTGAAERIGL